MSVPIKMKITKEKLQQIIKEEYQRALSEIDPERHGMGRTYSAYEIPGADEVSFDDTNRFVKAYNMIADAVENGQLPESVEDAVFDMLRMLDINL
jgi:hypothetical protein